MSNMVFCRKIWFLCLVAALALLNPVTGHAAGNVEDYRAVFDADYYYHQYPDLQETVGYDQEKLLSHFMSVGAREGRSGNEEFNLRAYVFYNRDLLDVYKTDLSAYCRHYVEMGVSEGRISRPQDSLQGIVGTYSTGYDPTLQRAVNIDVAVQRINGVVLQPGEAFSFSNTVLSRTTQNGYVMAPAIGRNEIGGGICQVSSTLYAAMCHGLLPATERHPHSSGVSYLPAGLDATISEGYKDLRFVNTYQEPLTILAATADGILTVSLQLGEERPETGDSGQEELREEITDETETAGADQIVGPGIPVEEEDMAETTNQG